MVKLPDKRRIVQGLSFLFLHSSFRDWMQLKWFCNPVLSCHSCALAWFACPVGVFVYYSGWAMFPYVAVGTLVLIGVLIGRLLCGWVCPFGTLQALLYRIPSRKIALPAWSSKIKYAVLLFGVFLFPYFLGEHTWLSFCRICPAAALQNDVPSWIQNGFVWKGGQTVFRYSFLVIVIGLAIVSSRSFCTVFCPIGAFMAPLNYISFWRVKSPTSACIECHKCDDACSTHVEPSKRVLEGTDLNRDQDCIVCHACQSPCPVADKKEPPAPPPTNALGGASRN